MSLSFEPNCEKKARASELGATMWSLVLCFLHLLKKEICFQTCIHCFSVWECCQGYSYKLCFSIFHPFIRILSCFHWLDLPRWLAGPRMVQRLRAVHETPTAASSEGLEEQGRGVVDSCTMSKTSFNSTSQNYLFAFDLSREVYKR